MLRFVPFAPSHVVGARTHPSQAKYQPLLDGTDTPGGSFSAFDGESLIGIGGIVDRDGRAYGWALFTDQVRPRHFVALHRAVVRLMRELEAMGDPMFAHIDSENPVGVRWARLLGLAPIEEKVA